MARRLHLDQARLNDSEEDFICWQCVGEEFLRATVRRDGISKKCLFCSARRKSIAVEKLADLVERAIKENYRRTSTGPSDLEMAMSRHGLSDGFWFRDGEPITSLIASLGELPEAAAKVIQDILESRHGTQEDYEMHYESEFASESHYEESISDSGEWSALWSSFEEELKSSRRYFSKTALGTLNAIFSGLDRHRTYDGKPVIVEAGPNQELSKLFRARVFHSIEDVEKALKAPERQLGPPPARLATAGRMNPSGIAVFYGALQKTTVLSEVRPPVGSHVIVGEFQLKRTLRLLELPLLQSLEVHGSIFDPQYRREKERVRFLGALATRMVLPVMPNDEAVDYLPTQVVCDFLASWSEPAIDGVIYQSVQAGQNTRNVVLFHHASRVEEVELEKGTKVTTSFSQVAEEDFEFQIRVEFPQPNSSSSENKKSMSLQEEYLLFLEESRKIAEKRPVSLCLNTDAMEVHSVLAVAFDTDSVPVSRHEYTPPEHPISQDSFFDDLDAI